MKSTEARTSYEMVPPRASSLVESLRAFGYTPEAALADLIDNSITAKARNIDIKFVWDGADSFITVTDDGVGMTDEVLREAMRPGSMSPLQPRHPADLGRFGLGLKTASFSQCRRVTVMSKAKRQPSALRCWDLDYVGESGEWRLLTEVGSQTRTRLASLDDLATGTVVLWEKADRLVGGSERDDQRAHRRFLSMIDSVESHMGMTFHRFLSRGTNRLVIRVNDREVAAWDPYMQRHPATQPLPVERLFLHGSALMISPYVLPHQSRLTQAETKAGAGPQGWNAQQGFYVYRNDRLLVAGSWLGLGFSKEEHYKLARISINLPNTMDHDWDINVTKSKAVPPGILRDDILRIARATRERAVEIYRHRGQILAMATSQPWVFVWMRLEVRGKIVYRVNREHPLIRNLTNSLGEESRAGLKAVLRLLEETLPVAAIVVDSSEHPDKQSIPFERAPHEVTEVMGLVYEALRRDGLSAKEAVHRLGVMEPFNRFPELIAALDARERNDR
jgi:hypothetical protein